MTDPKLILAARDVSKRFGGVRALEHVDISLHENEVHGLCGENGSGKSTLLKILSGQLPADSGTVMLDGDEIVFRDASEALAAGISTVTQETTLVSELSVAENIFLGRAKPRTWRGIDWMATRAKAVEELARLNVDVDPVAPVGSLRPDLQQMVEIARALTGSARVLILDEPTSALADDEVESLFDAIRALRGRGIAVVFVSHRLNEIFEIAGRLTVLRDGKVVGGGLADEFDQPELVRTMIGRDLEDLSFEHERAKVEDVVLSVTALSVPGRVHDAELEVGRGEAVGIAGLVGSGRSELVRALFGLEPEATGTLRIAGAEGSIAGPNEAISSGLALVPSDRKRLGLVLDRSVRENLLMAQTSRFPRLRRPRFAAEQQAVETAVDAFRIVLESARSPVSSLSGGNQQKVVLAKWFGTRPKVLLMDEPTRGVDVGSKAAIYQLLDQAKQQGLALIVSSSETAELQLLCDRILVMYRGRVVADLERDQASEERIARYSMGHGG